MKRKLFIAAVILVGTFLLTGCSKDANVGMPNPWSDCGDDLQCAANAAGFNFPLVLSNYSARAMNGLFEITYPLDEFRSVTVRKSLTDGNGDISGVYNDYPVNKEIMLYNAVPIQIRGNNDKIYVMNMSAESGYYSAYCEQGMTLKEVEGVYNVIAEAEAPKLPD